LNTVVKIVQIQRERALWVCPENEGGCGSELVYPLDWWEEGSKHWRIVLRCPECEHHEEGVFTNDQVECLDEALDRGSTALLGDLRRMTHANMSEEAEVFIRALVMDLVLPEDF
jgi:hypothetical protein